MSEYPTITVHCKTHRTFSEFPDKGLGRAFAAAWLSRHPDCDTERSTT